MKLCLATSIIVPLSLSALSGCMHQSPASKELQDARAEYARARDGIAMRLDPADVHEAWVALRRAETAYRDAPGALTSVDLAVVADRKALLAESEAEGMEARQQAQQATASIQQTRLSQLRNAQARVQQMQQTLGATEMQMQDAQSRLRDARESISKVGNASVRDDERGMIITVQSEVLFNTGQYALRPAAVGKLDQIADALHGVDQPIEICGYTDSVGGRARNMTLSNERARVVRDYLVSRGIPRDQIKAKGKGPDEPVAENVSVEGRAQNRRVEIIVEPAKRQEPQQGVTSPQQRGGEQNNTWQQNNVGQPRK